MTTASGYVRASTQEEVKKGSNEQQKDILEAREKVSWW
jgi:DNA invertase Pin-like site-specific DNA recombinase